jgi:hypothetical protein
MTWRSKATRFTARLSANRYEALFAELVDRASPRVRRESDLNLMECSFVLGSVQSALHKPQLRNSSMRIIWLFALQPVSSKIRFLAYRSGI